MELPVKLSDHPSFKNIKSLYENHLEDMELLNTQVLINVPELASFKNSYEDMFRKRFTVACANAFELHLNEKLLCVFCSENVLLKNFVEKQALERKYHQLFSWDNENANAFFRLFGEEFKKEIEKECKNKDELKDGQKNFMYIGRKRNEIVHQGFDFVILDDDVESMAKKFEKAAVFYDFVWDYIENYVPPA